MDDFFMKDGAAASRGSSSRQGNNTVHRKRQRPQQSGASSNKSNTQNQGLKKKLRRNDQHVDGDSGDDDQDIDNVDLTSRSAYAPPSDEELDDEDDPDQIGETPTQKRLRLAKAYIEKIKEDVADADDVDAEQLDRDLIAERLQHDALESAKKAFNRIASKYAEWSSTSPANSIRTFKNGKHLLTVTAVAVGIPTPRVLSTATSSTTTKDTSADSSMQRYQQFLQPTDENPRGKASLTKALPPQQPVYIFSASKDGGVSKHDLVTRKLLWHVAGGVKPTKKVTGGRDKMIHIWSAVDGTHLGTFKQHRDAVSGLAFRKGQYELYSASFDRTIKVWNVEDKTYVETLFGHQDSIPCISALHTHRCLTSGSRDRTVRIWKIPEESHLIFRAGTSGDSGDILLAAEDPEAARRIRLQNAKTFGGSIDVVEMITDEYFLSASESGSISLWNVGKKKPLYTRLRAHIVIKPTETGKDAVMNVDGFADSTDEIKSWQCWISCLASVPYSDMFASGMFAPDGNVICACDGFLRVWKIAENFKTFGPLFDIPMDGFINSAKFFYAPSLEQGEATADEKTAKSSDSQTLYVVAVGVLAAATAYFKEGFDDDRRDCSREIPKKEKTGGGRMTCGIQQFELYVSLVSLPSTRAEGFVLESHEAELGFTGQKAKARSED
ncbi:hypothetical protein SmJEL517_g00618 [Synchytrium microbalum]|uniref:Uncharacterized protein n=1 Tax=Synchytrium microbalum TaxID=1806994 RepID=A0A507CDH3_9FUNG|nr:uncharacterized protein SmJEL517_g00618 [Synchytrium microbalum]TPX37551.1 hypothetical protein SmJEL517_g00618 [Synchytrium microbalum]